MKILIEISEGKFQELMDCVRLYNDSYNKKVDLEFMLSKIISEKREQLFRDDDFE